MVDDSDMWGDFTVFLDERVSATRDELQKALEVASYRPEGIVSFFVHHYEVCFWQK